MESAPGAASPLGALPVSGPAWGSGEGSVWLEDVPASACGVDSAGVGDSAIFSGALVSGLGGFGTGLLANSRVPLANSITWP